MFLTRSDIGKPVMYFGYDNAILAEDLETGIITGFNDKYVFVKYGRDSFSKATNYKDLRFYTD